MPLKPTITEIHQVLRDRSALIVHFSGAPRGAGTPQTICKGETPFPDDLLNVLRSGATTGVSTSTVTPQDRFALQESRATGFVGVVLGLTSTDSLAYADVRDCGSGISEGKRYFPPEKDIAVADLRFTIDGRQYYNEWVLRDYGVLGLFAAAPYTIWALIEPNASPDLPPECRVKVPGPKELSLDEVRAHRAGAATLLVSKRQARQVCRGTLDCSESLGTLSVTYLHRL